MPRFHLAAAAAALTTAACLDPHDAGTTTDVSTVETAALAFPIEVMPLTQADLSGETFVTERTFDLGPAQIAALNAGSGGKLWLQGHGLGYRDGHSVRDGKASVSLNGGDWVRLYNDDLGIDIAYPEIAYGGIGGGFRTVRLTIDHATLCGDTVEDDDCFEDHNTIAFKFHGTDGTSSGYRIIDLKLLAANGVPVFSGPAPPANLDTAWGTPSPLNPDVAAGEALWRARNKLYAGPGGAEMIASCSDCHAQDGTDLEYFGFSGRSIVTRSVFHGLSEDQGAQIATYIRSLPASRHGRPWNPPYQPGVDLDARGVDRWAAGAGLGAVLDHEDDTMFDAIFPAGATTPAQIVDAINGVVNGVALDAHTLNLREVPIAIQLPDWNSWLPETHPLDMWGVCAWEGAGDGTLAGASHQAGGVGAEEPVLADLDGDYFLDAVVIDDDGNNLPGDQDDGIRVLRGAGDGTFNTSAKIVTGGEPEDLAIADLDGDRKADVLVASRINDKIYVLRGNGAGGLTAPVPYPAGDGVYRLAIGDFDRDFDVDVASVDHLGNTVTVMRNNGGALTIASTHAIGYMMSDVAAGDVNGDGNLDLVITIDQQHRIGVMFGNGAGGFTAPQLHTAGDWPERLGLGDVDRDGDLDVAVLNGGELHIMHNDGGGASFTRRTYATTLLSEELELADLDRDGWLDVVVTNRLAPTALVSVYRGLDDGTLDTPVTYGTGGPPTGIAIGDLDRDWAADVVVTTSDATSSGVSALRGNRCAGPQLTLPPPPLAYEAMRTELARLDVTNPADLERLPDTLGSVITSVVLYLETGKTLAVANQGGLRTIRGTVIDTAVAHGYSHELVRRNIAQWSAVKTWEVMRELSLEDKGDDLYDLYGDDGEIHQWPTGAHQSVFFIAPHITSGDQNYYKAPAAYPFDVTSGLHHNACEDISPCIVDRHNAQNLIEGDYDSSAWYHLQMLLHPGARSRNVPWDSAVSPVDWPYVLEHIDDLPRDISLASFAPRPNPAPPWESLRFLASLIKLYQMRNNGMEPSLIGWSMRDVSPRILVGNWRGEADDTELLEELDTNTRYGRPGLRLDVTSAFLTVFLSVVNPADTRFDTLHWPRLWPAFIAASDERASWFRIDVPTHVPTQGPGLGGWEFPSQGMFSHANDICRAIPRLRALYVAAGANTALVDALEQWAEVMWPGDPTAVPFPQDFSAKCW